MNEISAVPVIITTLYRYEHFVRCIESLKKNKLSKYSELYVGVDYPPDEKYVDGNNKILEYLQTLNGFKHIHILQHKKNLGSEYNFFSLRDIVLNSYDKYISMEDDCEVSENFLEYMNIALTQYENDPEVLAVSGYVFPNCSFKNASSNRIIRINTYFSGNAFGWWRDKEIQMRKYLNLVQFEKYYLDKNAVKKLRSSSRNQYCNFVKGMVGYIPDLLKENELAQIDLSFGLYMFFENKTMIFPVISKMRNWGYDGTGEHCSATDGKTKEFRGYDYSSQPIDGNSEIEELIEDNKSDINHDLEKYFMIKNSELFKTDVAYHISRLIGLSNMRKLIKRLV